MCSLRGNDGIRPDLTPWLGSLVVHPDYQKQGVGRRLIDALSQFYFRAQGRWCASGKSIVRYLEQDNPEFAAEFLQSFEAVFQAGDATPLEKLTQKILKPYGGLLWDGYKSEAPAPSKLLEPMVLEAKTAGYPIYLEDSINPEVAEILSQGLKSYNESKIGKYAFQPFTIYVKSLDGSKIIGGCYGDITLTNCYVDYLWVDEDHRHAGLGSAIMAALEEHVKNNYGNIITIETADFQGKDFYERLGYLVIDTYAHNCFLGYKVYLMRKSL